MSQQLISGLEDMTWLRDVHLPDLDPTVYRSAVIHGKEDYPSRIDVYESAEPVVTDRPVVYKPDADKVYRTREDRLVLAAKRAIPWLVLLGDFIGNGIAGDENGRCDTIQAIRNALDDADDVVAGYPGPNPARWRPI